MSFKAIIFFFKGTQKALRGDTKAMATVTAIIDGTGSLGRDIRVYGLFCLALLAYSRLRFESETLQCLSICNCTLVICINSIIFNNYENSLLFVFHSGWCERMTDSGMHA